MVSPEPCQEVYHTFIGVAQPAGWRFNHLHRKIVLRKFVILKYLLRNFAKIHKKKREKKMREFSKIS